MSEITCNLFFKYFRSDKNHFYCFRVKKKEKKRSSLFYLCNYPQVEKQR